MKLTFLGTSSMLPTKDRNTTAILLSHKAENILIDCGEGTQRQLRKAQIPPTKITRLLITHWHGDHVLGIPGLLETLAKQGYTKTLYIYGPVGTKKFLKEMYKTFISQYNEVKVKVKEITKDEIFINEKDFTISSLKLNHTTTCYGYSFQEKDKRRINLNYTKKFGLTKHPLLGKLQQGETITFDGNKITPEKGTITTPGKKITILLDTAKTKNMAKFAENSDILIAESTLSNELEKEAMKIKHLIPKYAAEIAKEAKVKKLILTHISQRYKNSKILEVEARKIFKNTVSVNDLDSFEI